MTTDDRIIALAWAVLMANAAPDMASGWGHGARMISAILVTVVFLSYREK